ncbi:hypothetical protein MMC25_003983 [Agyrium rufum]|nr:hypothetical protein [Agyrium rufum]
MNPYSRFSSTQSPPLFNNNTSSIDLFELEDGGEGSLGMLYGFPNAEVAEKPQVKVINEDGNPDFAATLTEHDGNRDSNDKQHFLIAYLSTTSVQKPQDTGRQHRKLDVSLKDPTTIIGQARARQHVNSRLMSCYYSTIDHSLPSGPHLQIWYYIRENFTLSPADLSITIPNDRRLDHSPVHFTYNLRTGRTTYLLAPSPPPPLITISQAGLPRLHPFTLHLALVAAEIEEKGPSMERELENMLTIECRMLQEPFSPALDPVQVKGDIQGLHRIARLCLIFQHRTNRDLANVTSLGRDADRLWELVGRKKETRKKGFHQGGKDANEQREGEKDDDFDDEDEIGVTGYMEIDEALHKRVKDVLAGLEGACQNIIRRLESRRWRIDNLITLLYQLTSTQDSATNIQMAREMRADSASMKTIATLQMLFLPATFVGSIFGTNFFALDTSGEGSRFVVSRLWWVFVIAAATVTVVTVGVWAAWMRLRPRVRFGRI